MYSEWTEFKKSKPVANLISINAVPLTGQTDYTSPCQALDINVANIQDVQAYTGSQYGIQSVINVKYVVANHFNSKTIYATESKAAIKAAANAALA